MKKALIVIAALITLMGCDSSIPTPAPYGDAPTQFIVIDIMDREGMLDMTSYQIEVVDANGLVYGTVIQFININ